MSSTATMSTVGRAVGRAAVYGLLARALAYPAPEHRDAIAELAAQAVTAAGVRAEVENLARSLPPQSDLEAAYASLLTHSSSRDCPPFETAYTAGEIFLQAQQMADIGGFYAAFGVAATPGAERPDHITCELEFMQFMAAKEVYAAAYLGAARLAQCRKAQRLFLQDHLACWGPAFSRRLAARDPGGWYGAAAGLLDAWLEQECRDLKVTPETAIEAPVARWPEQDTGACGLDEALDAPEELDACAGCLLADGGADADADAGGRWPMVMPLPLVSM